MNKEQELKALVRSKYSEIALQSAGDNRSSCCGAGACSTEVYNIMTDSYEGTEGYAPDADLGLGCGLPTQFAKIKPGDTVVDLGSGAGNDCFVARAETGTTGRVIGIDFTPAMIAKASANAEKLGYGNVEFREGDIENMPLAGGIADVVVSNCVLNLVPNKAGVFREIFRILKPGGHFSISDVVLLGELPESLQQDAEMYAGCVAGAIQREDYLALITATGFEKLAVQKQKPILIPEDILAKYPDSAAIQDFKAGHTGIVSITVFAKKPLDIICSGKGCC